MTKSDLAGTFDNLQRRLDPLLRDAGFRKSSRIYNRTTADGLIQVIDLQMGRSDPPGTTHIPGLRENLYGLFAVNLGVYVPEVARHHGGGEAKSVVRDGNCSIRTRIGHGTQTQWRNISDDEASVAELRQRLQTEAFPFFQRFETRDQIVDEFQTASDNAGLMATTPRIVCAIILFNRGERERARLLLTAQARDQTFNPRHKTYVVDLAQRLGLEIAP